MKLALVVSLSFHEKGEEVKRQLEGMGHQIVMPPSTVVNHEGKLVHIKEFDRFRKETARDDQEEVWKICRRRMKAYYAKLKWADAALMLNYTKNGIKNYVGGNALIELGAAFFLRKKIYFLNPVPDMSYREEMLGMKPAVINGDLGKIA